MLICISCNNYNNKEILVLIQMRMYTFLLVWGSLPRPIQDFSDRVTIFMIYILVMAANLSNLCQLPKINFFVEFPL